MIMRILLALALFACSQPDQPIDVPYQDPKMDPPLDPESRDPA